MGHLLLFAAMAAGMVAAAQERGAILIATEPSRDPDFARTVVLVIEHDSHKSTGLVLNRPVKISLAEVFPELRSGKGLSQTAWAGGPVLLGTNALLRAKSAPRQAEPVMAGVYLIASKARMQTEIAAGTPADSFRVYLGVCGWGVGQLENEIRLGLWRVAPGAADIVFDAAPGTLWSRLMRPRGSTR